MEATGRWCRREKTGEGAENTAAERGMPRGEGTQDVHAQNRRAWCPTWSRRWEEGEAGEAYRLHRCHTCRG